MKISNLLRSTRWCYQLIADFLQAKAIKHVQQFVTQEDELPLLLWGDSEI